jgi:hypothetical protein
MRLYQHEITLDGPLGNVDCSMHQSGSALQQATSALVLPRPGLLALRSSSASGEAAACRPKGSRRAGVRRLGTLVLETRRGHRCLSAVRCGHSLAGRGEEVVGHKRDRRQAQDQTQDAACTVRASHHCGDRSYDCGRRQPEEGDVQQVAAEQPAYGTSRRSGLAGGSDGRDDSARGKCGHRQPS